jgi:predicted dehydrogenase
MTIRTALIGFGIGGRYFHEPLIGTNDAYDIRAVVTSSPERRALAEERYRVLGTAEEVWARAEEFDLAVVTSPTACRAKPR